MSEAPRDNLVRSAPFALERADDDTDGLTLRGHGAVFNEWTVIDSWEGRFKERIAPGAFKKTLKENGSRVRLQFDHGQHPLIGSLPIGAIRRLAEDDRGLFVEARLADNWLVQPVREAIENGSIDGMSFRFAVIAERWNDDGDIPERTITEVRLSELGPVVWPAYEGTDVGVRSLELARSLMAADDHTRHEIATILLRGDSPETKAGAADGTPATDTQTPGAADGTPGDRAVTPADEPAEGHSRSTDPESDTYQPAQRPVWTAEQRHTDAAAVRARLAAVSARSA
jgi:HK97 family phage prohead protease